MNSNPGNLNPGPTGLNPPMVCPLIAPGGWPGTTDEEKEQIRLGLKYTAWGSRVFETCVFKTTMAGVGGFGLGAIFSLFTSAMLYDNPHTRTMVAGAEQPSLPLRTQAVNMFRDMGRGMYSQAKSFGKLGAYFSACECVIEGYRGRHDIYNVLAGGWLGGALMTYKSGPRSAATTGIGFALFGAAIHAFMEREPPDEP